MYCPRCSQQQVSEEVRFCSRCGLPLGAVKELVAAGGELAERAAEAPAADPAKALKGVRKGVKLMLAAFPLALFAGVLTANEEAFAFLFLLPVLCLVAGFARTVYGTFVEGRAPRVKQLGGAAPAPGLPTPRAAPVEDFAGQRLQTAEMIKPPSVTEGTTRLLEDEPGPRGK